MLNLILDSGAFTAWSKGTPVDIDEYIAYAKANAEGINHVVALDVIPGEFGRVPTPAEVEASAAASWENLLYMQKEGIDPVPVFHQGERFYWLHKMIKHGCKYIGISPANDRTTQQKRLWLDRVFGEICDAEGWPVIQTHAFGVTAVPLLMRYPWYSADSSTWAVTAGRGGMFVPYVRDDGSFKFDSAPQTVYVSTQQNEKKKAGNDSAAWKNLTDARRQQVLEFIAMAGTTFEACQAHYSPRARVNAFFFLQVQATKVDAPFKAKKTHLFKDE